LKRQKRKASIGDPAPAQQKAKTTRSKARETSAEEDSTGTTKYQGAPKHRQAKRKVEKQAPYDPSKSSEESDEGEGTSNEK